MTASYLSPSATVVPHPAWGLGTVAAQRIPAGSVVAAFGGSVAVRDEIDQLSDERRARSMQVEDRLYLEAAGEPEDADRVNHSCEPNCGMRGSNVLVAMRDIEVGEWLTFDYGTCDGSDYHEFECVCGAANCRGRITGNDWMLPELQLRLRGWFSPYLAARIADLVSVGAERRVFSL
ncbi:MAG: SET domain-containing protein [Actinomycetota bacterium]